MNLKKKKEDFKIADVMAITIAHHIHDIYTSFLAPLQNIIMGSFGLNNTLFGLLSVAQRIPTLLNPFIGIMAEKVRIRYLMIVSPTITAIAMSLIGTVNDYYTLLALVFISGISSMLFHVPTPVMMRQVSGSRVGKGMSYYMMGGEFARTLGPVVVLAAVEIWGFNGIFRLIPAGILSSIILYIRFRKVDLRKNFKKLPDEGSHGQVLIKHTRLLSLIAATTFFRGAMKSAFTYYLVGYLSEVGWGNWFSVIALSTIYLSGTVGVFITGRISDVIGKRIVLLVVSTVSPILMLLFIFSNGYAAFPLLIAIGFFLLAPTPVFLSMVNSIKSKHVTFLNGVYMTSNFLMSALATMLAGFAFDTIGYDFAFKIAAALALLAIPTVLFLPKN